MSNELVKSGVPTGQGLMEMIRFGNEIVKTGFLPRTITTGAQVAAIVLTGQELGIPPMQSLRSISIVNGRPVLAADLQLGLFFSKGGKAEWLSQTDTFASIKLTRTDGTTATFTFTIEDAKRAKLDGKDVWKQYPQAMLRARVITASLRAFAPDYGFAGFYDPEEMNSVESPHPTDDNTPQYEVVNDPVEQTPEPVVDRLAPVKEKIGKVSTAKGLETWINWLDENKERYTEDEYTCIQRAIIARGVILVHDVNDIDVLNKWSEWLDGKKDWFDTEDRKPLRIAISVVKSKFPKPVKTEVTPPVGADDDLKDVAPDQPGLFDTGDSTSAFLNR